MNIYEIDKELQSIIAELEESGGDLSPELAEKLAINDENFQEKITSYLHVIANVKSESDGLSSEIKRLQERKKSNDNTVARLKETIQRSMQLRDLDKMEAGTFKLSLRSSVAVQIEDADHLPSDYMRLKAEPNKTATKKAIDAGQEVQGARLVVNQSLQVK